MATASATTASVLVMVKGVKLGRPVRATRLVISSLAIVPKSALPTPVQCSRPLSPIAVQP